MVLLRLALTLPPSATLFDLEAIIFPNQDPANISSILPKNSAAVAAWLRPRSSPLLATLTLSEALPKFSSRTARNRLSSM
jgi:hypothetical protein